MIESTDPWSDLETLPTAPRRARRRIHPETPRDLFVELELDSRHRLLTYRRPWTDADVLPEVASTRALGWGHRPLPDQSAIEISVMLREPALADLFTTVARDLSAAIVNAPDDSTATSELVERMARWQELFLALDERGLGHNERRGLVGELLMLREHLIPRLGGDSAVAGWTGPLRRNQDFQFPGVALEVKATTALNPQGFTVNNERELDADNIGGARLILVHVSLDERRGDGTTLLKLIDDVDLLLDGTPLARQQFRARLGMLGFADAYRDHYLEPHYDVRHIRYYDVAAGFPRIGEADLRDGVGRVVYRVDLASCADYEIDAEGFLQDLHRDDDHAG